MIERSSQNSPRQSEKHDSDAKFRESGSRVNIPTPSPPIARPLRIEAASEATTTEHKEQIPLLNYIQKNRAATSSVKPVGEGLFIATPYSQHRQSFFSGSFSQG